MAFKFLAFACVLAVARAGIIAPVAHYAAAPAHYASAPAHYAAAPVAHYAAAPVAHYAAAPVAHYAPAKVAIAAPVAHHVVPVEHHAPAEYNFEYSVHDEHTGDIKSQHEERHGDNVHGSYSLIEADGSRRVVEYTADEHNGFNAVVHREHNQHAVAIKPVVKVAAPVAYAAAPAYHHGYAHAAPVVASHGYAHAAPVAIASHGYAHAAPVAIASHGYAHAAPAVYAAPAHHYHH